VSLRAGEDQLACLVARLRSGILHHGSDRRRSTSVRRFLLQARRTQELINQTMAEREKRGAAPEPAE
jgi:hypothetical protein